MSQANNLSFLGIEFPFIIKFFVFGWATQLNNYDWLVSLIDI